MVRFRLLARLVSAILAATLVSACATPFRAQVNRFQAMPVPQGQTFHIAATDPARQGSLEFAQYAGLVSQKLQAVGYQPAPSADAASLIVRFDYGIDQGRERLRTVPGSGFGYGFGPWGRFGYYGAGWSPWYPYYGYGRRGFVYGFHDPFLFGGGYDQVESYTVYTSTLSMNIERKGGERVFEGSAKAMSRDDNLTELVPNLVEALFTGFPGNSGETVKITVAPPDKRSGG